ncbi:hypothetical protein ACFV2U_46775 [Streptomyces sp. NPDC059697]|uniref:hypothetical protein n=1 Tax=Streptomyces sp. NPDC059697 TaxID=3346912 RepID=UPI0036A43DD0
MRRSLLHHLTGHHLTEFRKLVQAGMGPQIAAPVTTPEEHQALAESAKVLRAAAEQAIAIGTT